MKKTMYCIVTVDELAPQDACSYSTGMAMLLSSEDHLPDTPWTFEEIVVYDNPEDLAADVRGHLED